MINKKFEDIAPLEDDKVKETIQELLVDPGFIHAVKYVLPDIDWAEFSAEMSKYASKRDFQTQMISPTIWGLASHKSTSINASGWKNLGDTPHLIISNHRDIVLDAGLLNILRHRDGLPTTEIAIGDNLLIHPWIEKLVRLNKSFIVRRGVSVRQMLEVSTHLSEYIHYAITEKYESVWLAQREGRAKDANDRTQESLLKMITLAPKDKNFIDSLKELDIVPLSISYEYDPCDYLKAMEFQLKRDNPEYKKTQRDDLRNMEIGILGFKGDIYFQFGNNINKQLTPIAQLERKEQIGAVAQLIDKEIHKNYKIFAINYIAYDLLESTDTFKNKYTEEQKSMFNTYIDKQIDKIDLEVKDYSFLRTKILEMYSNTLKNHLIAKEE
jgi:hypothetical protein